MPQKTFDIGECSYYGRWKIEVKGKKIIVQGIDWDTRKVETTKEFSFDDAYSNELEGYLTEQSTSYYVGKMMEWVKDHIPEQKSSVTNYW